MESRRALRVINSVAPIRIVDNGGWTDTWFAGHGKIFNIGVYPYAEVQIEVFPAAGEKERVIIEAENYGDRYAVTPEQGIWNKHPLLEAAIHYMKIPAGLSLHVTIYSEAPAGASTGTSAAVSVALIGALDRLTPGRMTPHEVAIAAHHVEMNMLHLQCGIQDQLCSAFGGINYIEMRIKELENEGPESPRLEALRGTAEKSRDAVYEGNFSAFGKAMIENTDAQTRLHPDLVSADALKVIGIAKNHGALGWKVNGAGGLGGSVSILTGDVSGVKRSMIREIQEADPLFQCIPIYLSRFGLRTWEASA
ncbi:MAG: kinase [Bacteroidetes bacterium]|nr:kinase [Bacteroidota bacterium]